MTGPDVVDALALRSAFACYPTGVGALCALRDGEPVGMTANSFTSVSLAPPLVSICVAHSSTTWPHLRDAPVLGLSVLGSGHAEAGRRLAAKGVRRFDGLAWRATVDGAVLVEDAVLWLELRLLAAHPAGDHDILVLEVERFTPFPDVAPLVFHGGRLRPLDQ